METVQSSTRLRTAKRIVSLWLPVLLWTGLIYYLSSIPGLAVGEGAIDFCTRKPAHIAEYAILFLLLFRAARGSCAFDERRVLLIASALTLLYAVTDEVHQLFVPLREGRMIDLVFDFLGLVVGIILLRLWRGRLSAAGEKSAR
jgi:VanZ family protein